MPTSSTTDDVVLPTGSQWLGIASSEMAVTTEVTASSSGMPAAISAPNTHSSSTSVIGTEVTSAWRKSELMMLLVARSTLASPDSATRRPGCAAWTAATARSAADDRLVRVVRVAAEVERDQRGAAVPRDQLAAARGQRRLDAGGDLGHGAQRRGHLPDGPADLRVGGHGAGAAPGLDQDGL